MHSGVVGGWPFVAAPGAQRWSAVWCFCHAYVSMADGCFGPELASVGIALAAYELRAVMFLSWASPCVKLWSPGSAHSSRSGLETGHCFCDRIFLAGAFLFTSWS